MSNEIRAKDIKELLEETIEDVTNTAKGVVEVEGAELSTGLSNLDEALGGLWPGELVCIAGTSRAGRRTLACQIAFTAAKVPRSCRKTVVFSTSAMELFSSARMVFMFSNT